LTFSDYHFGWVSDRYIRVITKLPNSEQSYKGKVKTHILTPTQQLYSYIMARTS
jgi:hypothetical protein